MTTDWSSAPEPVPYVDLENPQSFNPYSDAGSNSVSRIDDDGHLDGLRAAYAPRLTMRPAASSLTE